MYSDFARPRDSGFESAEVGSVGSAYGEKKRAERAPGEEAIEEECVGAIQDSGSFGCNLLAGSEETQGEATWNRLLYV